MVNNSLVGPKIKLVKFSDRHMLQYHSWINTYNVNKYLYMGRIPLSQEEIRIPRVEENVIMFAMFTNIGLDSDNQLWQDSEYNYYIGTATIHNIDWISRHAEIGYMIGKEEYWNAGLGTELVGLITNYAFDRLNLIKLTAYVVETNEASSKALTKNGFQQYAVEKKDFYVEGKYLDAFRFHNFKETV